MQGFLFRSGLTALILAAVCLGARADEFKFEPQQLWLNAGIYNYHLQTDKNLRNANPGLGAEYHYDEDWMLVGGRYINANDRYTTYLGATYQPWRVAGARVGALVGLFNGYPCECNGNSFVGAAAVASWEFQNNVGLNLVYVPRYDNRSYESLGVQFKVRLP